MSSTIFYFTLYFTNLTKKAVRITSDLVNLSTIISEYHKFIDVFSKAKAEILASHHLYNLQIKLESREKLLIRTIYLLLMLNNEVQEVSN